MNARKYFSKRNGKREQTRKSFPVKFIICFTVCVSVQLRQNRRNDLMAHNGVYSVQNYIRRRNIRRVDETRFFGKLCAKINSILSLLGIKKAATQQRGTFRRILTMPFTFTFAFTFNSQKEPPIQMRSQNSVCFVCRKSIGIIQSRLFWSIHTQTHAHTPTARCLYRFFPLGVCLPVSLYSRCARWLTNSTASVMCFVKVQLCLRVFPRRRTHSAQYCHTTDAIFSLVYTSFVCRCLVVGVSILFYFSEFVCVCDAREAHDERCDVLDTSVSIKRIPHEI